MRRRPECAVALAVGVMLSASCHQLAPAPGLVPGWAALEWRGSGYVALYRLACCGQRELLATVRAGEAGLGLTVVAPPGVIVLDGWLDDSGGWVATDGGRCRQPLPRGAVPLPDGTWLPLPRQVATALLAGRIPPGGAPDTDGWVAGREGEWHWRARVVGTPPRCVAVQVRAADGGEPLLAAVLAGHRGGLPRSLAIGARGTRIRAELGEWRSQAGASPPAWLTAPLCGGGS